MPTYSLISRQIFFYFRLFNFFYLALAGNFFVRHHSLDKLGEALISLDLTIRYFRTFTHMEVEASFGSIVLRCGIFPSRRSRWDYSVRFSKIVAD